jgi:hypothetical protein
MQVLNSGGAEVKEVLVKGRNRPVYSQTSLEPGFFSSTICYYIKRFHPVLNTGESITCQTTYGILSRGGLFFILNWALKSFYNMGGWLGGKPAILKKARLPFRESLKKRQSGYHESFTA